MLSPLDGIHAQIRRRATGGRPAYELQVHPDDWREMLEGDQVELSPDLRCSPDRAFGLPIILPAD